MLREAFLAEDPGILSHDEIKLKDSFDPGTDLFMYGTLPENPVKKDINDSGRITVGGYYVNHGINRLHLKFHGENWLQKAPEERKSRINYGLIMHEILESVMIIDDIPGAIRNMLIEGRITEKDKPEIEERMLKAMSRPEVKEWFLPGLKVMNESEILTVDGTAKRPDRVIVADDKVIIIDFKFGKEKNEYLKQVKEYGELLEEIEKKPVEGYLWYVDNDKIVKV
jgi:hypothetical protein